MRRFASDFVFERTRFERSGLDHLRLAAIIENFYPIATALANHGIQIVSAFFSRLEHELPRLRAVAAAVFQRQPHRAAKQIASMAIAHVKQQAIIFLVNARLNQRV